MQIKDRLQNMFSFLEYRRKEGRNAKRHTYLHLAYTSHTGRVRKQNEDNLAVDGVYLEEKHQSMKEIVSKTVPLEGSLAYAIFDGMGGEYGGEIASHRAAKAFAEYDHFGIWDEEEVKTLILSVNDVVCQPVKEIRVRYMGTTMNGLFFNQEDVIFANVGDSSSYIFRDESMERMYQAHTNEDFLRRQGITNRKPALIQFLGLDEEGMILNPYAVTKRIQDKDMFLLCSDGLTDMVPESEIENILRKHSDLEECTACLLQKALDNGGRDNITIFLGRIEKRN